jgi:hypothetical protein
MFAWPTSVIARRDADAEAVLDQVRSVVRERRLGRLLEIHAVSAVPGAPGFTLWVCARGEIAKRARPH